MHLQLKADRESIRNNLFDQFLAGDGVLAGGNFFERGMLLRRHERGDPGNEEGAESVEVMLLDHCFCPVIILVGSDDELDFIGGFQVGEVGQVIALSLAAAGAFEIHDSMNAFIGFAEIVGAAGFEKDRQAGIAELGHEREDIGLEEGFAAGEFDEGQSLTCGVALEWPGELENALENRAEFKTLAFGERIRGIAVRATEVASGEADKNTGPPGPGTFALDTEVDFIDDQAFGHDMQCKTGRGEWRFLILSAAGFYRSTQPAAAERSRRCLG